MRCVFAVQGEGRGHMTQALALRSMLRQAGVTVCVVLVGQSRYRSVPAFFKEQIDAPLLTIDSPGFVTDDDQQAVRLGATIARTLPQWTNFARTVDTLDQLFNTLKPDLLINFYEPVVSRYYQHRRPDFPMVCVGHQYLALQPDFPFPSGAFWQRRLFTRYTAWTALHADRCLALSFYPTPAESTDRLTVVPPLLRPSVFDLPLDRSEDFVLVYLVNHGYAEAVRQWHHQHLDVPLRVFWDHPEAPDLQVEDPTLMFYRIHDRSFLDLMARCRSLVCTAGFESICEALYLGKQVLAVPVSGHYEQACNALDALRTGAVCTATTFDIDQLLRRSLIRRSDPAPFRAWVAEAEHRILTALLETADPACPVY